jgi:hypothetical protein
LLGFFYEYLRRSLFVYLTIENFEMISILYFKTMQKLLRNRFQAFTRVECNLNLVYFDYPYKTNSRGGNICLHYGAGLFTLQLHYSYIALANFLRYSISRILPKGFAENPIKNSRNTLHGYLFMSSSLSFQFFFFLIFFTIQILKVKIKKTRKILF